MSSASKSSSVQAIVVAIVTALLSSGVLFQPLYVGETGPTGDKGPTGDNGANGLDGNNGANGVNGTNGVNGSSFSVSASYLYVQNTTGVTFSPYPTGDDYWRFTGSVQGNSSYFNGTHFILPAGHVFTMSIVIKLGVCGFLTTDAFLRTTMTGTSWMGATVLLHPDDGMTGDYCWNIAFTFSLGGSGPFRLLTQANSTEFANAGTRVFLVDLGVA